MNVRLKGLGLVPGTRAMTLEIGDVWVHEFGAWAVVIGTGEQTHRTRRITYRWAVGTPLREPTTEHRREVRNGTLVHAIFLPDRIELLRERVARLTSQAETFSHSPGWNLRARSELQEARSELSDAEETAAILAV